MASKRVGKIASSTIKNREQTPVMQWIRNTLLAVDRDPKTPAPGIAGPDGRPEYKNPSRYPNTQASRAIEMPNLPGGINNRLSDVYYFDRDGRRTVKPPAELYRADENTQTFIDHEGKELSAEDVTKAIVKGPAENFGLNGPPTPGDGFEWKRNPTHELATQKYDPDLKRIEKFDRYTPTQTYTVT